jgi:hypothetical protein
VINIIKKNNNLSIEYFTKLSYLIVKFSNILLIGLADTIAYNKKINQLILIILEDLLR